MEELNVKAGDKVIRSSWHTSDICEVVKVTPKGYIDIKLGGGTERFNKYGDKVGRQRHDYTSIHIPKDGEIEGINREREREQKRSYIRNYPLQNLPLEALRELVSVIEKYEKK